MLLSGYHQPLCLAGVRRWSNFVCLFGLKLLGAQKNRLISGRYHVILGKNRPMFLAVLFGIISDQQRPMRFTGAGGGLINGWTDRRTARQTDRYIDDRYESN